MVLDKVSATIDRDDVFCRGPLLHTVQMSKIFDDSKTFVDMKMKHPPQEILQKFDDFMKSVAEKPTQQEIKEFVHDNFEESDVVFDEWYPRDWSRTPDFLDEINKEYRDFGLALHRLWRDLGREISEEAQKEIDRSSLISVPNPMIVPGGRFREIYYWDSFWIIKGLLVSDMHQTARGMLDNFLHLVDRYGYVPNGGRIYYLGRSQPPTLIPAFKSYMQAKFDREYLEDNIHLLEKEFEFWMTKRTIVVKLDDNEYTLATYGNCSGGPRPESYAEDVAGGSIAALEGEEAAASFYSEIKAACESGMDFTSRWFVSNGTNKGSLQNIKTTSIIPVDLNAILYSNAVTLKVFSKMLHYDERAAHYEKIANKLFEAIRAVFWHDGVGMWLDYDLENRLRRNYFYASNLTPLWAGCYVEKDVDKVIKYLQDNDILNYPGGVPQSLDRTGEQWDFPNAWPPSQHLIIFGLKNTEHPIAQKMAEDLAKKWLTTNHQAYLKMHHMAEKYDASSIGHSGGGGEYQVQFGFGWTNGVILDILVNFFSNSSKHKEIKWEYGRHYGRIW